MKTLTFEELVATIDVDTLEETASLELAYGGLPKNRPVEHHQCIRQIKSILEKTGNEVVENPIYISKRHAARVNYKGAVEQCPIENYLCQRLVTKIDLKGTSKEYSTSIGISYTEKGIQLAYGMNVWVCSNLNVFGGEMYQTFGSDKLEYNTLIEVLESKIENHQHWLDKYIEYTELLKAHKIGEKELNDIFGRLIQSATEYNTNRAAVAPMNITQVVRTIEESHKSETNPLSTDNNLWDVMQWGTSILKPKTNDMATLLPHTNKWSNFVLDYSGASN